MATDIHPESRRLFKRMRSAIPESLHPSKTAPIRALLPGCRLFPGGSGVWTDGREFAAFPVGGAMIVGQDWGTVADYADAEKHSRIEPDGATWTNLLFVLREAKLPPQKCFFTNFWTGLRRTEKRTGEFPDAKDERYLRACGDFFIEQVGATRPRLIALLGSKIPRHIAELSDDLREWRGCKTSRKLDDAGALKTNVRFGAHAVRAACWMLHPSMRRSNLRHRRYKNKTGAAAEKELMQDAIQASGIFR